MLLSVINPPHTHTRINTHRHTVDPRSLTHTRTCYTHTWITRHHHPKVWNHPVGVKTSLLHSKSSPKVKQLCVRFSHILSFTCGLLDFTDKRQVQTCAADDTRWHIQTFMRAWLLTHTRTPGASRLWTVPNKHQMAFLFLDGEACQHCRGTGEGGQEWEWKSARWRPPLGQEDYQSALCFASPFSTPEVTFTGNGGCKWLIPMKPWYVFFPCTVEKTAHSHNTDLIYSVGWIKEGYHIA